MCAKNSDYWSKIRFMRLWLWYILRLWLSFGKGNVL